MVDVLIVGAGPTGLVLALWLTKQGIKVRIIDRTSAPGSTSRAMVVQARTLELYRQLELDGPVTAAGHKNPGLNLWVGGKRKARLALGEAGERLTPFPFVLLFPQDHHERLLIERLEAMGVPVERETELIGFEQAAEEVTARLRRPDGQEEVCAARYVAGCDGARSPVRHVLGIDFAGATNAEVFYVADVEIAGPTANGEIHVNIASADFVAILAYGDGGQARLIGTVRGERAANADTLKLEDIDQQAIQSLGLELRRVHWFSTYRVHHRVAERYRRGRAFLLGDAAHVHSPAGGQGMNTGIGDAVNLAWKLAAVLRGRAPDSLLDSYEAERQAFARKLVDTTDRLFSLISSDGKLASFVRTKVAPTIASVAYGLKPVRELMFRAVSQTLISYADGPLSSGKAGKVRGGDRLPWVPAPALDNHAPLSELRWQVHVYGAATAELATWCAWRGVPLHQLAWTPEHEQVGLARDAAYLIRPDTYIAVADPDGSAQTLEAYASSRGLVLGDRA